MKLIGIGDNVVDVYLDQNKMYPGGNSVNVAVLAKRAGATESAYIGIIGDDKSGDLIKTSLASEGIDLSHLRVIRGSNGRNAIKLHEGDNDRMFVGSNRGGESIKFNINLLQEEIDYVTQYDVLHTSVHSEVGYLLPILKDKIKISMDFSDGYTDERIKKLCPYLDVAFFSGGGRTKEHINETTKKALDAGAKLVVTTMGLEGSLVTTGDKTHFQSIYEATDVVDTLGAGDTYISAFLVEYFTSGDMIKAADSGAQFALETLKYNGAFGYAADADISGIEMVWPNNPNPDQ